MKQTQKTNQRGFTLVEIAIVIVVLLLLAGIGIGSFQGVIGGGRVATYATMVSTIETQSELAEIQTGCTPFKIGFLITGDTNTSGDNNSCGTAAGNNDSFLKLEGTAETTVVILTNIHPEAQVQFTGTSTVYLQIDGPDAIMLDLARNLCGTQNPLTVSAGSPSGLCSWDGTDTIWRRIGQ